MLDWTTNIGYPGYATNAINEVANTYVLNTTFARVARGEMTAAEGARSAESELKRIFERWK